MEKIDTLEEVQETNCMPFLLDIKDHGINNISGYGWFNEGDAADIKEMALARLEVLNNCDNFNDAGDLIL